MKMPNVKRNQTNDSLLTDTLCLANQYWNVLWWEVEDTSYCVRALLLSTRRESIMCNEITFIFGMSEAIPCSCVYALVYL